MLLFTHKIELAYELALADEFDFGWFKFNI